jgi:hypothetical protein
MDVTFYRRITVAALDGRRSTYGPVLCRAVTLTGAKREAASHYYCRGSDRIDILDSQMIVLSSRNGGVGSKWEDAK